jgi:membrane protease YdiL (CAAX protease family)
MSSSVTKLVLLMLPVVLTFNCLFVFKIAAKLMGRRWGYFTGFLFYWIVWCTMVPVFLLGPGALIHFFRMSFLFDYKIVLCLCALLIFVYAYAFPKALQQANSIIIILSFLMAIINATLEEVLWRSSYLQTFSNGWISVGFASLGFALWHYAPLIIVGSRNPGGSHAFVLFTLLLGLCYGYVAYRQQTVFWTTLSHTLLDFSGLGAMFYFDRQKNE